MRLVVTTKSRLRCYDVGPFCKALSPPFIVLRNRVELGKMESDGSKSIGRGAVDARFIHRRSQEYVLGRCTAMLPHQGCRPVTPGEDISVSRLSGTRPTTTLHSLI